MKKDSHFDRCHGNGETAKIYQSIEHKFTPEFQKLTLDLLAENYIRFEMLRPGKLSDREYGVLKNTWRSVAEELGVLYDYPYNLHTFPHAHPFSRQAARLGKEQLGIEL